jgi:putative glutamine amidotransferase
MSARRALNSRVHVYTALAAATPIMRPLVGLLAKINEFKWSRSLPKEGPHCVVGIVTSPLEAASGSMAAYARAVVAAGGTPRLIYQNRGNVDKQLSKVDAVLITGGYDMDPRSYGETRHDGMKKSMTFPKYDRFEIDCTRGVVRSDKPLLAICRGMQVMNVALGGTLVQDIPSEFHPPGGGEPLNHAPAHKYDRVHDIDIEPASKTAQLLGQTHVTVNSAHHQSIDTLAPELRIVARAPDGVPEAAERDAGRFQVAVQFHPEAARRWDATFDRLFRGLVEAGSSTSSKFKV